MPAAAPGEQWGEGPAGAAPAGGSPGFLASMSSGGESSGPEEMNSDKKKRRSKPRGGRGHGGSKKKPEAPGAAAPQPRSPGTAGRRVPNAGPGILPDPEPAALARPVIELALPKHLAHKAAAQRAANGAGAGGKAPRRPALATELRVDSFNPYARKTPSNTPNALTPATQLTLRWARTCLTPSPSHTHVWCLAALRCIV